MKYKEVITQSMVRLFNKYHLQRIGKVSLESFPGNISITIAGKEYEFFSNFSHQKHCHKKKCKGSGSIIKIPIMSWRNERRYIEMKKLITTGIVRKPRGMKIKNIFGPDKDWINEIIKEIDIGEWILNDRIAGVFAVAGDNYYNIILSTKRNIKISLEIGRVNIDDVVILHEIISEKGVISDMPVDTQINHYPVYVLKSHSTEVYTDIDFELPDLRYEDVAKVRFIFDFFKEGFDGNKINGDYRRHGVVVDSIFQSVQTNKKVYIEEP